MKRILLLLMVLVLVMSLLVGCSSNGDKTPETSADNVVEDTNDDEGDGNKETLTFRLAENHAEGYPTTMADREFARLVDEATDGRIKIEVYPNEQLGDEKAVVEQVQFGALEFARVSISPVTEFEPSLSVLMLPYIYRDVDHMFSVIDGEIGDEILEKLEESSDIVGLCWFDAGSRNFYNTKKEIKSPDDLKGLKIRVQETELMMDLVSALGASPTPMGFGEVYSALQTGVIDGAENNWSSFETTNHYEVSPFFTVDEHTRVPELIITNTKTMNSLSSEDQEIIKEAALKAAEFEREEWVRQETAAEEFIKESGVTVTYLESNREFQEKVQPLYEKHGAGYEDLIQRILNTK